MPTATDRGRWIPGKRSLILNIKTTGRVQQIYQYDVDTALLTQLTFDAGPKNYAYMWQAPEFNNDYIFFCTVEQSKPDPLGGPPIPLKDTIGLYSYDATTATWKRFNTLTIPDLENPFILSPQQFVYNGRSYISLVVSATPGVQDSGIPTYVWIAGIDAKNPLYRRVSSGSRVNRNNPKSFFLADGRPYIYYQGKNPGDSRSVRVVHICDTGL